MSIESVGFIGLGIMGRPMALNLRNAGYKLNVYARRPNASEALASEGVRWHGSPQLAAAESQVTISMVSDTRDVEEVLAGPQGVIHGAGPGSIVVDMSTISPVATRRLAQQLMEKDIDMLDAPVSGGGQGAIHGTLSIMVGGKRSVFDETLPLFQCMGQQITYIGESGAGQVAKACNQVLVAQTIAAVGEALLLAKAFEVDPVKVREALLGGFAYSKILEFHGQRILRKDYSPGFKARLHQKDMRIAMEAANELGIALPGAAVCAQYLNTLVGNGGGDLDSAAIATVIERLNASV